MHADRSLNYAATEQVHKLDGQYRAAKEALEQDIAAAQSQVGWPGFVGAGTWLGATMCEVPRSERLHRPAAAAAALCYHLTLPCPPCLSLALTRRWTSWLPRWRSCATPMAPR